MSTKINVNWFIKVVCGIAMLVCLLGCSNPEFSDLDRIAKKVLLPPPGPSDEAPLRFDSQGRLFLPEGSNAELYPTADAVTYLGASE